MNSRHDFEDFAANEMAADLTRSTSGRRSYRSESTEMAWLAWRESERRQTGPGTRDIGRMDWLEGQNQVGIGYNSSGTYNRYAGQPPLQSVRAVVDAAIHADELTRNLP